MKKVSCVVALLVATVPSSSGSGAEPPDTNPSFWMTKKLEYSQKILGGRGKGGLSRQLEKRPIR